MQIFVDVEDNLKFLEVLKECKEISGFKLYAYCLMGNHIHLLLQSAKEDTGLIFKRLGARYVHWYNTKYDRVGYLFQGRYKSEPVENEDYLLTVVKYIHMNPVVSGLAHNPCDFRWSSYHEYENVQGIVDASYVLDIVGKDEFFRFHCSHDNDEGRKTPFVSRMPDGKARQLMQSISGCATGAEFQNLAIDKRDECIRGMKKHGISARQISRLTGLPRGLVGKV